LTSVLLGPQVDSMVSLDARYRAHASTHCTAPVRARAV
jgi:hypothetical protein